MISQVKSQKDENRRLKRMFVDLSMQADLLKEAPKKLTRSSLRREMAAKPARPALRDIMVLHCLAC